MSDTFASSAKPPWAVIAWVDERSVYIELPVKDQAPFITSFQLNEQGLSKALNLMRKQHKEEFGPQQYQIPHREYKTTAGVSDDTRAKAHAILRRMGIIG